MAAGLPDLVDCARLAEDAAVLRRVYELDELPRLRDLLTEPRGTLSANFVFAKLASGRSGAEVSVDASPRLVCQRCMQGFGLRVTGGSEIEFATSEESDTAISERELFRTQNGQVSLRDLAEEELLLALPIAPACSTPLTCGKAPSYGTVDDRSGVTGDMRRPFSALHDLLKKT
jgi:uncharacterized metal-binding protein YceD (DUF177 family)